MTQSLRELVTRDRRDARRQDPRARRTGAWPCSTWRARSSRRTSWSPTCGRGWPTCPPTSGPRELASVFGKIPRYLQIDRRDRGDFLRTFFRRYEGASVEGIDRLVANHVGEFMLQKASAAAIRRVRDAPRRRASHDLDHGGGRAVHPAAGAAVRRRDRRASWRCATAATPGFMSPPPLVGEARSAWLKRYALLEGVDLKHSYAYADSLLRPAAAARGRQPGRRVARRRAVPVRAPTPVADRGVGHDEGDAARAVPEAGDPMGEARTDGAGARALPVGPAVPRRRVPSAPGRPVSWPARSRRSAW